MPSVRWSRGAEAPREPEPHQRLLSRRRLVPAASAWQREEAREEAREARKGGREAGKGRKEKARNRQSVHRQVLTAWTFA